MLNSSPSDAMAAIAAHGLAVGAMVQQLEPRGHRRPKEFHPCPVVVSSGFLGPSMSFQVYQKLQT
jgi:hypothetical protein